METTARYAKLLAAAFLCTAVLSGCFGSSNRSTGTEVVIQPNQVIPDPGAVEFVWEPPLVDVVDVPPGLDPEGIYYRPAHQEIVEIRPGRWRYYKLPE